MTKLERGKVCKEVLGKDGVFALKNKNKQDDESNVTLISEQKTYKYGEYC